MKDCDTTSVLLRCESIIAVHALSGYCSKRPGFEGRVGRRRPGARVVDENGRRARASGHCRDGGVDRVALRHVDGVERDRVALVQMTSCRTRGLGAAATSKAATVAPAAASARTY